ncbi:hypothetical protein HDK90DRAFT_482383, partial [Phyllosticta capitalensis]
MFKQRLFVGASFLIWHLVVAGTDESGTRTTRLNVVASGVRLIQTGVRNFNNHPKVSHNDWVAKSGECNRQLKRDVQKP